MMLKNINSRKIFKYLMITYLLIQPIFDLKVFYNSISTLIRVIVIGILFFYYFFTSKNNKKYWFIIYPIILAIYFFFHNLNATHFYSLVPGNFDYSLIKEILYFVKMICPFLLIYSMYKSDLKKEDLLKILKILVCIVGLIIIISNIFVFSYGSYSDELIKANFFSWFSKSTFTYQELASKGLFEYANQISAILLMLLPFSLSEYLKCKKTFNILTTIINTLALFLLGTKVSVLGVVLVYVYTIIVYIFQNKIILNRDLNVKNIIILAIILIAYVIMLPSNPIFMRIDESKTIEASSNTIDNIETSEKIETQENNDDLKITEDSNVETENQDELCFIANNYEDKRIKKEFILESYPYQYDTEFWMGIFEEPLYKRVDFRFMEKSMVKRVVEINNNKMDKFLGITNTRLQNIFNIEQDFIVQYYALGIIGVILMFLPYFILLGTYAYKMIYSKFKHLTIDNILAFISIWLAFGISYFSGNLLNSLSFTIYLTLLYVILNKEYVFKE